MVTVTLPDASAEDVERLVVDPIEKMLREKIKDINHVNSNAANGSASVNIEFKDIKPPLYERRMQELRREIQALALTNWPKAQPPDIQEANSFSQDWYKVLVYGPATTTTSADRPGRCNATCNNCPGSPTS